MIPSDSVFMTIDTCMLAGLDDADSKKFINFQIVLELGPATLPGLSTNRVRLLSMTADAQALGEEANECTFHFPNTSAQKDPILPIHRLPPELLSAIFIQCARDHYHKDRASTSRLRSVPGWVNVSYVCRRWRAVALGCPTLWSHHFVLSLLWTEELLARSKQAPLKVCMLVDRQADHFWWLALLERLVNHGERIQEFYLAFPYGTAIPEMLSKLSFRARCLQTLTIKFASHGTKERSDSLDLPSLLLDGGVPAPNLRELELSLCPVPWYSFTLSMLTTLRMRRVPLHFRKDVAEFLTILASLQGLTQLYLDEALADTPGLLSSIVPALPKISLPRLTRLLVVAPFSTIATLLSCTNIPLESELRLDFLESALESTLEDYNSLSSLLAHRFGASDNLASSLPAIRSLVIHDHNSCQQGLELIFSSLERDNKPDRALFCKGWHQDDNEWGCGIPLKIFIEIPMSHMSMGWHDRDRIMNDICRLLPLENVQSVHTIGLHFSLDRWRETFGHFPGLRHIKVRDGTIMCNIVSTLSNDPLDCVEKQDGDMDQRWNQRRPFAPALLEGLELHGVKVFAKPKGVAECISWLQHPDLSLFLGEFSKRKTRCRLTMTKFCMEDGPNLDLIDVVGWWEDDEFKVEKSKVEWEPDPYCQEDDDNNLQLTDKE